MDSICDDLTDETEDLIRILKTLDAQVWDEPTPAAGWSVRDQVSHLTFFDYTGTLAAIDPDGFAESAAQMKTSGIGTKAGIEEGRLLTPAEVLENFIRARTKMISAFRTLDPKARLPWYGPAMGARSFATARLMETWAHGQDIADAVNATRVSTNRLKHVAHIGVSARPFSYAINKRPVPEKGVAVVLTSPGGDEWEWNHEARGENAVAGSALDFCLVVTQRRHVSDTDLLVTGPLATEWISIAQAFAGDPGTGRAPGQFS
jgi:uncharacterized protein (TIGR03084 family)